MKVSAQTVLSIRCAAAELTVARQQIGAARQALDTAMQAEADAVAAYNDAHASATLPDGTAFPLDIKNKLDAEATQAPDLLTP